MPIKSGQAAESGEVWKNFSNILFGDHIKILATLEKNKIIEDPNIFGLGSMNYTFTDGFSGSDNGKVNLGSTTAKYNGTEYIIPEAAGGSWSGVTTLTGTYANPTLAINTSNEVALIFVDEGATPNTIDMEVRAADESQVTASTTIASPPGANHLLTPKAIGIAGNYWCAYREATTNNVYLTVINNAGTVQFGLTQDEVTTSIVANAITKFSIANNGTRCFVFGLTNGNTQIYYSAYAISDGTKDISGLNLGVAGSYDYTSVFAVGDTTNTLIYVVAEVTTATDNQHLGTLILVLNNNGDIIKSKMLPNTDIGAVIGIALSNDKTRLAIYQQVNMGVTNDARVMMIDTTTLNVIGSDIVATNTPTGAVFPAIVFGPDDRAYLVGQISNDTYYAVVNKDGKAFVAATQIAAETIITPVIIFNQDNTDNKLWISHEESANNDIEFRTYDFQFDTAAAGFVVWSNTATLSNNIDRGIYDQFVNTPSNTSITGSVSADSATNFEDVAVAGEVEEFTNAGSNIVLKATLKTTDDFSTPKLKGWGFVGERT